MRVKKWIMIFLKMCIRDRCLQSGIQCYQNGLNRADANMRVEDFRRIISECRENTYQVALGGCGDPDQHEAFEEILNICRDAEIVPNFRCV